MPTENTRRIAGILIAINVVIILVAQFAGGGYWFASTGLVHGAAVLFVLLAATKLYTRPLFTDPELRRFTTMNLLALGVFGLSHVMEYVGYNYLKLSSDTLYANVINLYLASLMFMIVGAHSIMVRRDKQARIFSWLLSLAGLLLCLLMIYFVANDKVVSLDSDVSLLPWVYAVVIMAVAGTAFISLGKLTKMMPMVRPFSKIMTIASVFVLLATIPEVFSKGLMDNVGVSPVQVLYLSHYGFYIGLSVMYLAFEKLKVGGVYGDIRTELDANDKKSEVASS